MKDVRFLEKRGLSLGSINRHTLKRDAGSTWVPHASLPNATLSYLHSTSSLTSLSKEHSCDALLWHLLPLTLNTQVAGISQLHRKGFKESFSAHTVCAQSLWNAIERQISL